MDVRSGTKVNQDTSRYEDARVETIEGLQARRSRYGTTRRRRAILLFIDDLLLWSGDEALEA